jgi:hypothetical protein
VPASADYLESAVVYKRLAWDQSAYCTGLLRGWQPEGWRAVARQDLRRETLQASRPTILGAVSSRFNLLAQYPRQATDDRDANVAPRDHAQRKAKIP